MALAPAFSRPEHARSAGRRQCRALAAAAIVMSLDPALLQRARAVIEP